MTELAHNLGLTATAEGIETLEQLAIVRELGCDVGQGFLISPPLEAEALISWKKDFRRAWPKMMTEQPLALWGDVEANTLGER
jgi:EAL domain-containing protein (putative c-di-GMP-specific phosphodiesterase class I)